MSEEQGFNMLSNSETERLALLAEECGEVIQAIGKILRHGYESTHPNGGKNNRQSLEYEISHVYLATQLMIEAEDIDEEKVEYHKRLKNLKVGQYLHHQEVSHER